MSSDFVGWTRDELIAEVMRLRRISIESLTFAQDALIDADYMESAYWIGRQLKEFSDENDSRTDGRAGQCD